MPSNESPLLPRPPKLLYNWISLIGAVFAAGSIFAFLLLFAVGLFVPGVSPYMGILLYVVSPVCFFGGLFLVLVGAWAQRNKKVSEQLRIDLSRRRDRKILVGFALFTLIFFIVTTFGSYETFHYAESIEFCGATCHVPMHPEYTAYLRSPHARVACVDCHVGAGAEWYVKSKINGLHQLFGVATGTFQRPIATPINNLRPAEDICERCHWPEKLTGNLDRTFTHYLSDDTNTPFAVRLLLKVGGGGENGPPTGIHWHTSQNEKVEYIATDAQRQVIPWVRVTDKTSGKSTVYQDKSFHDDPAKYAIRTMDCVDCHSQPSHRFMPPNEAVDESITAGRLDRSVPKLKLNVVTALTASYQTNEEALQKIAASLRAEYPNLPGVDGLIAEAQKIYQNNFFPEMKTDWRTHPDNAGHKTFPGCFRCHDGNHVAEDGKTTIPADNCNSCHIILAQGSGDELTKLKADGYDFHHIDSTYLEFSCTGCHTGGPSK